MSFTQNDVRALILITGSREPVNPRALQAELGLRRETVSRLITHLVEMGLAERSGREVVLADTPPAEAFKRLYFSHRASPLHKILSLRRVGAARQAGPDPQEPGSSGHGDWHPQYLTGSPPPFVAPPPRAACRRSRSRARMSASSTPRQQAARARLLQPDALAGGCIWLRLMS